jgi:rhamnogalacturonyl hydrolase YesR
MDRRAFVGAGITGAALLGVRHAAGQPASAESQGRIERATVGGFALQRRDWEQGIFAQAMLESGQRDAVIRLTRAAMVQQTPDGRMGVVVSGGPTDPAMGGEAYARAAAWTGDPAMRDSVDKMLEWIRHQAPRAPDGTLYHVFGKPEMWSDGLNAAPPFLAAMGFHDEALAQIEGYQKRLWNPGAKLFAHIWDDGQHRLTDPAFWGGGNGWAAAGLARVIRLLPPQRRDDRNRLAAFARNLIDGCLQHQRPDGLFHNIVDQPNTFVETNLAQMLAFSVYEGVAAGWLDPPYRAHADRMRDAARAKMDADGFVLGVCGAPNFDRPGLSTEGQAFCIMMEAASERARRGPL